MTPRAATPDDALLVAELLDAFNREFNSPTPGVSVLSARLARLLARTDTVALLAGEVGVALITFRPNVWSDQPVGLLDELYVVPPDRNHGIGTALIAAAEAACQARGTEWLEIQVDGGDTDARRFYERHGYANLEPGETEPTLWYFRELGS